MSKHVVIVGGGLSGLAAGVQLASRGVRVTILEQKPALGGRAYSFQDTVTGDTIDNGQHILIAGYTHTMGFLETIGTRNLVRVQRTPSLLFHHPQRGFREFRLPALPIPLNLLVGILGCTLFSFSDRLRVLRAGLSLRSMNALDTQRLAGQTIYEWLVRGGQSPECIGSFWKPIAVSIVNENIEEASALVFVRAMRTAFLAGSQSAALAIPSVGLSRLYVEEARRFIALRGGEVRCGADVLEVVLDENVAVGVRLRDKMLMTGDAVILTVSPNRLVAMLPAQLKGEFSRLATIRMSPIVSVHLWFVQDFMPHESVGLIGRRIQWLFNRRLINGEQGKGSHVSAVISGAYDFVDRTKDELVKIAVDDIRSLYPDLREEPRHAIVIREKRATYSSSPATEPLRPPPKTGIPNLFLAGDWTATGYPATIEGAVCSAERAANLVLACLT